MEKKDVFKMILMHKLTNELTKQQTNKQTRTYTYIEIYTKQKNKTKRKKYNIVKRKNCFWGEKERNGTRKRKNI